MPIGIIQKKFESGKHFPPLELLRVWKGEKWRLQLYIGVKLKSIREDDIGFETHELFVFAGNGQELAFIIK